MRRLGVRVPYGAPTIKVLLSVVISTFIRTFVFYLQAISLQCNYQKLSKTINIGVALTVALFDAKVQINKLKQKNVSIYNYTKGIESPIPFLNLRHHDSKYHVICFHAEPL